jgi:hypothetical protein
VKNNLTSTNQPLKPKLTRGLRWRLSINVQIKTAPKSGALLSVSRDISTGLSRVEVSRNLGITFTIVPDIGINEGIDATRNLLSRCWFDEEGCVQGVSCLDNYRKEWNDRHGCWSSKPLHNFASHGVDAFRMLVVGFGKLGGRGLTGAEWRELRAAYI